MKNKHRGIERMAHRKYRIRVRAICRRTGVLKEVDRIVDDVDLHEARRLREQWRADLKADLVERPTERMTVKTYSRSWLRTRLPRLKPSTRKWYAHVLQNHVNPRFGSLFLDVVTKREVEEWVADQADPEMQPFEPGGKERKKPPRPTTINGRLSVAKMLFGDAASEYGFKDPTVRVRPLPTRDVEPRRVGLTGHELHRLLEVVREQDPEKYALVLVLALTGMRWGEATALKVGDVDYEGGVIKVVRAHVRGAVSTTKSGRPRTYPLPADLADALHEHQRRLVADQHPGLADGWLFATKSRDGKQARLPTPRSWQKCLPRWTTAAEIDKHVTPHSFRRTFVDLLRRSGVDAVVARSLVGHADEGMRELYSTVATDEQRAAMSGVTDIALGRG